MKKYIDIKIFKKVIILSAIIGIGILGINYTFCYPTKINAYVAANVYSEPANSYFDDDNFYQCVVDAYNDENGTSVVYTENLTDEQLATITYLECNNDNVFSANGIEKLINLSELDLKIFNDDFSSLNLENNMNLTYVYLDAPIVNLNLSSNIEDLDIAIHDNINIDFSKLRQLKYIRLRPYDETSKLDKSFFDVNLAPVKKQLIEIYIEYFNNKIDIDLSDFSNLEYVDGYNIDLNSMFLPNSITDISLYYCTLSEDVLQDKVYLNLENLYIVDSKLEKFDLKYFPNLVVLWLPENNIKYLDFSNNLNLTEIAVSNNNLAELDVRLQKQLVALDASNNNLSKLNVDNNTELVFLGLKQNNLVSLNLSNNSKIKYLTIDNNKLEKELVVYLNDSIDFYYDLGFVSYYDSPAVQYLKSNLMTDSGKFMTAAASTFRWYEDDGSNFLLTISDKEINVVDSNIQFIKSGNFDVEAKYVLRYFKPKHLYHHGTELDYSYSGKYAIHVVEAVSDKYVINNDEEWIYIGNDKNVSVQKNIKIDYATINVEEDKIVVKHDDDILKEFAIMNIDFGDLYSNDLYIVVKEEILYSDFVANITISDGLTYKLFNNNEEITSGNVEKDMVLKVYYNDEEIDTFIITDEYFVVDESINIDNDNMYFNNIDFNTTADMILNKIDTTGEVTIKNKDNEVITGNDLIGTGSVVSIKLSKETYNYTVIIHGDVDGDGVLKLSDIMKIANYTYKNKNSLSGVFELAADFDNNGTHNLQDIMKSAKALYGGK